MDLTNKDLDNFRTEGSKAIEDLCKMAELMGYKQSWGQLQINNAFISSFLNFLEDNPGAVEAVYNWVRENYESELEANDVEYSDDDQEE